MAWWDDEDQNPDINYLDYSKRKILFQDRFENRRMCVDGIILNKSDFFFPRSLSLSEGASKSVVGGSMDVETTVKMLPSQLLRRWRKAGRILNVANALGKIQAKKRQVNKLGLSCAKLS